MEYLQQRNNSESTNMKMKKGLCAHQSNFMRSLLLRFNSLLHFVPASRRRRCRCRRRSIGCFARLRAGLPISAACSRPPPHAEEIPNLPSAARRSTRRPKLPDGGDPASDPAPSLRRFFVSPDGIPSAQQEYDRFVALHPAYLDTLLVDELRQEEFSGLDSGHVFLDYSGHGLFSQLQRELDATSSSFVLAPVALPMPLPTALRGGTYCGLEDGTVESDVRRRVMRFLNVDDGEYGMVFAASKIAAFELLAESYRFDGHRSLLTLLDYESDAVRRLLELASGRGAQLLSATFDFPSLALRAAELKAQIRGGGDRRPGEKDSDREMTETASSEAFRQLGTGVDVDGAADTVSEDIDNAVGGGEEKDVDVAVPVPERGLFVFPVQSRVSGGKYSYQWMSLAQRHGWHVLLDASANDMSASLAFSLFRPDFMVASFYNVFGSDPTGFACLFVKHSAAAALSATAAASSSSAIVRLVAPPNGDAPPHSSGSAATAAARHPQVAFSGAVPSAVPQSLMDADVNHTRLSDAPLFPPASPPSTCAPMPCPTAIAILSYSPSKGKAVVAAPLTPRSVLEDGLTDGHGYSNGASCVGESGSSSCSSLYRKGSNIDDPVVLSVGEAQKAKDRRRSRFWSSGRYSHNIGWARPPVPHNARPASLSQPLDGRKRNSLLEGDMRSRAADVDDDDDLEFSSSLYEDDDNDGGEFYLTDDGGDDGWRMMRRDPEIYCRGLNHADALGRSKTNERLRYLISWLVSSMQELRHRVSEGYVPVVRVYGPGAAENERGASMAFNVFDREGAMVSPAVVQAAAREEGIYVGAAELANLSNNKWEEEEEKGGWTGKLAVVSASLGFFTNFQDVYRLWAFSAKFLDPSFYPQSTSHCQRLID